MERTHYKFALQTIAKGLCIFFKSWGVTMNRLLHDILHGIRHHWLFAVTLVALYAIMFIVMAQSRADYHHLNMVNYELSQSLDSVKLMIEK